MRETIMKPQKNYCKIIKRQRCKITSLLNVEIFEANRILYVFPFLQLFELPVHFFKVNR